MKNYSRIIVVLTAVMIAGLVLFAGITGSYRSSGIDTLYVNNIVQTVREKWNSPEALDSCELGTELLVFDSSDILWYSSADSELEEVECPETALSKGYICLAVSDGTRFLGTVVMPDPDKSEYDIIRRKLLMAGGVMIAVMLLSVVLYGLYVRRTIVKPFRNMEKFAGKVAAGELDTPIIREKDNMFGAFTESFDLMRSELKKARIAEKKASDDKKEMVAKLSHDIKTPVASIKSTSEVGMAITKEERTKEMFGVINAKTDQIKSLVDNLFTSSVQDITEIDVNPGMQPSDIISGLIRNSDYLKRAGSFVIPECNVFIDKLRLQQVFDNIFMNSYKYADTAISVNPELTGDYLVIRIADEGPGVKEEELPLLKEKFRRGSNASDKDGAGLGLYLTNYFMEKMDGQLGLKNLDKGFEVSVYIRTV